MMSNARRDRLAPHAALLLAALALAVSACSSTGDVLSEKLGGLPEGAPQRPATALPTPNVYEVRPTREATILHKLKSTEIVVQGLRIGDIAIATTPCETYALTGLKMKLQSPLPQTKSD